MGMDQYLLIPFLVGWTSIYQLFWCSPGVQGFDTLPYLCGIGLKSPSSADEAFFEDTKWSLWWLPEVNNMCRVRALGSRAAGEKMGVPRLCGMGMGMGMAWCLWRWWMIYLMGFI
jgi:hypothetical protein